MSETSAIYHPDDPGLRAINVAGRWRLQRHCGLPGTPTEDPWVFFGHWMDAAPNWKREP